MAREHREQEKPFDPERRGSWRGSSKDLVVNPRRHRRNPKGDCTAEELLPGLRAVVDTALSPDHSLDDIHPGAVLVSWGSEDGHTTIAVISYTMDTSGERDSVDEAEAIEIAKDYANERGWIDHDPDYVAIVEVAPSEQRERFRGLLQGEFYDIEASMDDNSVPYRKVRQDRAGAWFGSNYTSGSDYSGSSVERANYKVLEEMCEKLEAEHGNKFWKTAYGGHGTYAIFFNVYACPEEIVDVLNGLEDYPSIDDDLLSSQEIEDQEENWNNWAERDYKRELEKVFVGSADEMTEEQLWESFRDAAESANVYWESQSGTGDYYIDIKRIVASMDEPPPGFVVEEEE